jgi:hypothetical protein
VASNRDGFFVYKDWSSLPNDQTTTHHLIPVIRATLTHVQPTALARYDPDPYP